MIKNRKLDHIGLACSDATTAANWYQEVLGFHVIGKFDNATKTDHTYFVASEDESVVYEIYTKKDLPAQLQGKIDHISYKSGDIEKDYAYCLEQGYTICTKGIEEIDRFWDNGVRYFKIKSPTGEEIEFCQTL